MISRCKHGNKRQKCARCGAAWDQAEGAMTVLQMAYNHGEWLAAARARNDDTATHSQLEVCCMADNVRINGPLRATQGLAIERARARLGCDPAGGIFTGRTVHTRHPHTRTFSGPGARALAARDRGFWI